MWGRSGRDEYYELITAPIPHPGCATQGGERDRRVRNRNFFLCEGRSEDEPGEKGGEGREVVFNIVFVFSPSHYSFFISNK